MVLHLETESRHKKKAEANRPLLCLSIQSEINQLIPSLPSSSLMRSGRAYIVVEPDDQNISSPF